MAARLRRLNYYWRLFATGLNFATFGLGGLLTAVFVMPWVRLWPGTPDQRDRRGRQVVHYLFRFFVAQMCLTGVISVRVAELERLRRACAGRVVVANHPSLIDVVLVVSLLPHSCCVVKSALWRNPFMAGVIRATGYISNAADSETFLNHSARALAIGDPVVVFPEGTRTRPGGELAFQRGAANIAVRNGVAVLPVVVRCDPPTLRKSEPWYHIPPRRAAFTVTPHELVDPAAVAAEGVGPAAATRQLNRHLEAFYKRKLQS